MTLRAWNDGASRLLFAAVLAIVIALPMSSASAHSRHHATGGTVEDARAAPQVRTHAASTDRAAGTLCDRRTHVVHQEPIGDSPPSHGGHDGRSCCAAAGCGGLSLAGLAAPWLPQTSAAVRSPYLRRDVSGTGRAEAPEPKPPRRPA